MSAALNLALEYVDKGWAVFPLGARSKQPIDGSHGFKDATLDPTQAHRWWGGGSRLNVAIATGEPSGVFVLDVDPRSGGDETLGALERKFGKLPDTVRALTGRGDGGTHFYFRFPAGLTLNGKLGDGLDVKSSGGYVVAPPSVHPDTGGPYRWDLGALPSETDIADAPAWLLEALSADASNAPPTAVQGDDARDTVLGVAFEAAGMLGAVKANGIRKVACPWMHEHTDRRGDGKDDSTCILPSTSSRKWGAFCCMHAHCAGRKFGDVVGRLPRAAVLAAYDKYGLRPPPVETKPHGDGWEPVAAQRIDFENPEVYVMASVTPIASADDARPAIHITTEIADVVDLAVGALASDADVFQRDGYLVHVVRTTDGEASAQVLAGTPQIRRVVAATLLERLTRVARWERGAPRAPAVPPPSVVQAILARGEYPGLRPLVGILEAPSLRPNGSAIQEPGYDRATGYLYAPGATFAAVPHKPTAEQACAARELLDDVVADFPFERPELGRAVFLAALMSALVRPAIRGSVPGFVMDANTRGSGKTLLADVLSLITTGRAASRMTFAQDETELEKVLSSFALRGAGIVCFDNVTKLGGEPLDKVLTAIDLVDLRVLGRSEIASLPWRAVVIATGNNVEILGDTCRRVLVVRLDSAHERPEERTDFRHPDLRAHVLEHRAELVVAALTILRAWHAAGRPPGVGARWGSFESWSDVIPRAIVFAGGADPMEARPTVMGIADTEASALATILDGWARLAPADGMTAKGAIATLYPPERVRGPVPPDGFEDLREAIEAIAPPMPGKPPSSGRLGYALRRYRRRVVAGRMLDCANDRTGTSKWRVVGRSNARPCDTPGAGDAGDAGDVSIPSRERGSENLQGGGSEHPLHPLHPLQHDDFTADLAHLGIGGDE